MTGSETRTHWPESREYWRNRRVTVTGGAGFLGSFVVEKLRARGASEVFVPRSRDFDLRTPEGIQHLLASAPQLLRGAARLGRVPKQSEYGRPAP